jgi:hypothetical protein
MADKLKSADMIPGSFGLPIIGELIGFLRKREEFYWQKHQDNGNIFKTSSLVFGKAVCLVDPAANRLVLKDGVRKITLTVVVKIFLGSEKTEEIDSLSERLRQRVSGWFTTLVDSVSSSEQLP